MSGIGRSRKRQQEPSVFLAVLGLIVAALVTVFQSSGQEDLTDALIGLMLYLVSTSYRHEVPDRFAPRAAFAMVRGAALWLVLAGVLYTLRAEPLTQLHIEPWCWIMSSYVSERFWTPLGWSVLSLLAYLFHRRNRGEVAS